MDCYLSQHSSSTQWTTEAPVDKFVETLCRFVDESPKVDDEIAEQQKTKAVSRLRWLTPAEKSMFLRKGISDVTTEGGVVNVQFLRISNKLGFRDLNTFEVSAGEHSTHVKATGRSLDYHVFTACPCCSGSLCRYVACFCCCCGVCPTKDWGQNEQTIKEIAAVNGLNMVESDVMGIAPKIVEGER